MQGDISRDMLDRKIEEVKFICLDTETTGLDPANGGRICEVAMLGSQGGERAGAYCTLLDPQIYISPEVTAIHGITNEMVKDSPKFGDIAFNMIDFLQGNVLICHNADFDVSFLRKEFELLGLSMPQVTILDTLKFARVHGSFSRNRLGIIAQELGFSSEGWHRAMADTIMTEKIFYYFVAKFKEMGASTLGDLVALQSRKVIGFNKQEI